ncbi:MAG: hypothetical protein DA408_12305 [Bacteroidetes bacterium]|nr:MAG: hypothetical protein C7N36_10125 [Bacteroidota bacterium]PTM12019.1 MAG: hypothetical protein DA408_12305 [Bacteroidota bacterium]
MELIHLDAFRRYYNTHIFPELQRTERLRKRLLLLLGISGVIIFLILTVSSYLGIVLISLFLVMPITFYVFYLGYRIQRFRQEFKPRIVGLILDFMNEQLNFSNLSYDPRGAIPKLLFRQCNIFNTRGDYYQGEDFIKGMVGEMPFALCELQVREQSPMTNKLQDVFEGVFLHAIFAETDTTGNIVVWPRRRKQYLTRSIKEYNFNGGQNQDFEINDPVFRDTFIVYAQPGTHVQGILSEPMQEAIVRYVAITGKDLYLSFIDRHIFAAISEERDLLEPSIFSSNLQFELVREFYFDIMAILKIVEAFDQTH